MFTSLDSIGSAVDKRPIEHVIATGEWPNEYFNEHSCSDFDYIRMDMSEQHANVRDSQPIRSHDVS